MDQVRKVAGALYRQLDTPRSLAAYMLLEAGEITQLQQLRADPASYTQHSSYFKDAIASDFLRKCPLPGGATDQERFERTVQSFLACEATNFKTNRRLYSLLDFGFDQGPDERAMTAFVRAWRKEVKDVLRGLPDDLTPRFSGGSTASNRGSLATIPDKINDKSTYYPAMACLLPLWYTTSWGRACTLPMQDKAPRFPEVLRHNVFFTVPKDSGVDRGCCMEASLAVSYQLAVGKLIREAITRAYGQNLTEMQPVHRHLARIGSLTGQLATIDLSNASNLLCRALPELVLPQQWFELVDSLRAPSCLIDGRIQRLEMFSSMGNGYTFELETLLFLTLAKTIARARKLPLTDVSVYGDDIICPVEMTADLLAALRYFGFEPNSRKTFVTGLFRESCGGDFFDGVAVRPHYLKEVPSEPQQWIALANGLRKLPYEWAHLAWNECLKNIPSAIRSCRGPEELGDVVIHDDAQYHNSRQLIPPKEEAACLHYYSYQPVAELLDFAHWWGDTVLSAALYGVDSSGVAVRSISSYRLSWVRAPGSAWTPN